jgi:hypothetical protein
MTEEVWEESEAILTIAKKCGFLAYFCFMGFKSYTDGTLPEYNMEVNSEDHV